jgi:hypothetical protein
MANNSTPNPSLTIEVVQELGIALIAISDEHPIKFRNEEDFYPLVLAYLFGWFPNVAPEHSMEKGEIDFRTGGTNPGLLEIAVAPRELAEVGRPDQTFPGNSGSNRLYPSQNRTELQKLFSIPQSQARNRHLLLVDFQDHWEKSDLKRQYEDEVEKLVASGMQKEGAVSIIYVSRTKCERIPL